MARQTDLQRFSCLVLEEIKDFREDVDQRFQQVDTRFDAVDARLSHITAELTQIVRRLDDLEEQVAGLKGFAKEIDEIRARVKEIERHLGINRNIAA
jgi:archaellum component FlaC